MKAPLAILALSYLVFKYWRGTDTSDVLDAPGMASVSAPIEDAPDVIVQDQKGQPTNTERRNHAIKMVVMPVSALFLICVCLGRVIGLKGLAKAMPASAATAMVSVVVGFFVRYVIEVGVIPSESLNLLGSTLLNSFFLPIIIFNSGWALPVPSFLAQLEYILIFAILGTIISTLIVAFGGYGLALAGLHPVTSWRENLAFGALISACDPVGTLATFTRLQMKERQPLLNVLLLGESMLNDAVAIVLFTAINNDYGKVSSISALIPLVFYKLFGAIFFGIGVAVLLILTMRMANLFGHTKSETVFIFASSVFCFAAATNCGFSGIISNLFAGIMFGRYARMRLSQNGDTVTEYLQISGELCHTCIFMLCGTVTVMIPGWGGIAYGVLMVLLCLFSRAVGLPVCGVICNWLKKIQKDPVHINKKIIYMMWHGGLRGGIALVLATELDGTWCEHKDIILSGTFFVMASLLFVMGSLTEIVLAC